MLTVDEAERSAMRYWQRTPTCSILEGHRIDLKSLDDEVHAMNVGLAWKSKTRLSPAARAFCEFVALVYPGPDPVHFD